MIPIFSITLSDIFYGPIHKKIISSRSTISMAIDDFLTIKQNEEIMKKVFLASSIILLAATFFSSCSKEKTVPSQKENELESVSQESLTARPIVRTDEYYTQLILNQSISVNADYKRFSFVLDKYANSTFSIVQELFAKGGINLVNQWKSKISSNIRYSDLSKFYSQHNIDTFAMIDKKTETIGALASFLQATPEFHSLDQSRQIVVIARVFDSLKAENYRINNPTNPLVLAYNSIINKFTTGGGVLSRLTADEVSDCLRDAIIGTIVGSVALIRDLVNVINGTNLGWSGIKRVAGSFLKTLGGTAVLGAVGFGLCIAWETFF